MAPWQQDLIVQISGHLSREIGPFYATNDKPTLHVLSHTGEDVTFLFEHYVYNYAQSGSDWADHYFVRGTATVGGDRLVKSEFELVRTIHLTESDASSYSPGTVVSLMEAGRDDEVADAVAAMYPGWDDPEPAY